MNEELPWSRVCIGLCVALVACHPSSSGTSFVAPTATDLGLSAVFMQHSGDLWGLAVSEAEQNHTDLNGDGDADDIVLHTLDLASGALENRGLALGGGLPCCVPFLSVSGSLVIAGVSEAAQGNVDLNGDGDADDVVLHVYDARTGVTTNLGLAAEPAGEEANVLVDDDFVGFFVSEAAQGNQDLDGDGTTFGGLLHVYDARTRTTTASLGRARTGYLVVHDARFAFTVGEGTLGDLNGDGDTLDGYVPELYDARTGTLTNLHVESEGVPPLFAGGDWLYIVNEAGQGNTDLNGDGDALDGMLYVFDPALATFQPIDLGDGIVDPLEAQAGDERVAMILREDRLDHTGDGDLQDYFAVVIDPRTGAVFDTGLAVDVIYSFGPCFSWLGGSLAFLVYETSQGSDLDGDGDAFDTVVHVLDTERGTIRNLRLDTFRIEARGGRLLLSREELDEQRDWNGDGDMFDQVLFVWDPRGGLSNTHSASSNALDATPERVLLLVDERNERRDLNQDGDQLDSVFVLYDTHSHRTASLALAAGAGGGGLSSAGRGVFSVYEGAQGTDLNGDGDANDSILYVIP